MRPQFTVFTSTYNRAHTLPRLYESLVGQTHRDFEWLIVDDGSTDHTRILVAEWQAERRIRIRYEYQNNSGKHIAFNRGAASADGEFFVCVDSDDAILPEALECLARSWEEIAPAERERFTGVVTLSQYEDGTASGAAFPSSPCDTTALDVMYKMKLRGDKWGCHRTAIIRDFPFPEDRRAKFVPERVVWDAIARKYRIRCINERLLIIHRDSGVRLTSSSPGFKAHVKDYHLLTLNRDLDYFVHDPLTFTKLAVLYTRYSLHQGDRTFMHPRRYASWGAYLLCALMVVPGALVFFADKIVARTR